MRQLNEKLDDLRRGKGYTYEDVHARLEERGIHVTPAAVGHWFNGKRKPRSMKNLIALCEVLDTTLANILDDEIEIADNAAEKMILKKFRAMSQDQRSALLALAATIAPAPYPSAPEDANRRHMINEARPEDEK